MNDFKIEVVDELELRYLIMVVVDELELCYLIMVVIRYVQLFNLNNQYNERCLKKLFYFFNINRYNLNV